MEAVAAEAEKEARENAASGQPDTRPIVNLADVRAMPIFDLVAAAEKAGVENAQRLRKQDLLFAYLKARAKNGERIHGEGVLEVVGDSYGFLRYPDQSYVAGPGDIYVSPNMIRRVHLNTGDTIAGEIRTPKDNERYFALVKPETVNGDTAAAEPGRMRHKVLFENLTPLFPPSICAWSARSAPRKTSPAGWWTLSPRLARGSAGCWWPRRRAEKR